MPGRGDAAAAVAEDDAAADAAAVAATAAADPPIDALLIFRANDPWCASLDLVDEGPLPAWLGEAVCSAVTEDDDRSVDSACCRLKTLSSICFASDDHDPEHTPIPTLPRAEEVARDNEPRSVLAPDPCVVELFPCSTATDGRRVHEPPRACIGVGCIVASALFASLL